MGLFGKKNKEKNVPFWRRSKEKPVEEPQEEELSAEASDEEVDEAEAIATAALEERAEQEQDEVEKARQAAVDAAQQYEMRKEAIALARQAAMEIKQTTEEPEESVETEESAEAEESEETVETAETEETEESVESEESVEIVETEETVETSESEESMETEETVEPEEIEAPVPEKKSFFAKIRDGLRKTKDAMISRMQHVVGSFTKIDDDLFDQLEETMIMSDLGPETSVEICDMLRQRVKERSVTDPSEIMGMIQEIITEMLGEDQELEYPTKPTVIMVIGVNGAGKTTTIGKLCHQLKGEGKKVIVAAADTFRAAAIDQLEVWTQRAGVEIVKHAEGSDPGSVVFDAIAAAKARNCDVLICDTAGRLHNKKNLMQELAKINRIIATQAEGCHTEILLVLDATTGQNAVNQARLFKEVADISGIVLTKLDGTAKGGIIVSIRNELGIPVKLVGVGEKIDDLQSFHGADFVRALFTSTEENENA